MIASYDDIKVGDFYKRAIKDVGFIGKKGNTALSFLTSQSGRITFLIVQRHEIEKSAAVSVWRNIVPDEITKEVNARQELIRRIFTGNGRFMNSEELNDF